MRSEKKLTTRRPVITGILFAFLLSLLPLSSPASADPMVAAACYDGAVAGYVTGSSTNQYLPSASGSYRTTNRCADINFSSRSSSGGNFQALIRVCFVAAGYCQSEWKYYNAGQHDWLVIASAVRDNTTFRLEFIFYEESWGTRFGNLIAF